MADVNLIDKILSSYSHFTKLEKKVADFVLENPQEVLDLTISDLAERCGVGDTTVFRFCRSLKLGGYQDFKLSLALSTHSREMLDINANVDVADSRDIREISQKILSVYTAALNHAYNYLNFEAVSRTVDQIISANQIYLYGFGGSAITSLEMQNKFLRLMPNISFTSDAHMQLTSATLLRPGDLAIIFCNSGMTKDCIQIAKSVRESGGTTVFITSFLKTPAAPYADILLQCGAREGPMQGGSISAIASQMYMVDILYAELFRRMNGDAEINKQKTSQEIAEKML